jgi:hypothetical protein
MRKYREDVEHPVRGAGREGRFSSRRRRITVLYRQTITHVHLNMAVALLLG